MRTLVIGATGLVGGAAADALEAYGDEVLRASLSSELAVDITDPFFPGFTQVSAAEVGQAYVKAVHGIQTGKIIVLDGR